MRHHTNRLVAALTLAVLAPLTSLSVSAKEATFPNGTVTIIVPYSAGGGTDTLARNLARVWSEYWKQPVVVVNRTGADGIIGSQHAISQPADGHTILMQVNQALFWPTTLPSANIDILRDFRLISKIQQNAMVFGVPASSPDKTFQDFIDRCKKAETPCSFGAATRHGEIMARQIADKANLRDAVVAAYKGTTPMMVDTLGGHLSMGMPSLSVAMPHIKSGAFRPLATGSKERLPDLPNLPTLNDEGLNMSAVTWYGIMVRTGTPDTAFNAIVKAVQFASKDPQVLKTIEHEGAIPVFGSPTAFQEEAQEEAKTVTPLLKKYLMNDNKNPGAAK